jgi:hypothetical protein
MSKGINLLDIEDLHDDEGNCKVCGTIEFYFDNNNVACCEGCDTPLSGTHTSKTKSNKIKKMKLHDER